jgi:hypothetical protein
MRVPIASTSPYWFGVCAGIPAARNTSCDRTITPSFLKRNLHPVAEMPVAAAQQNCEPPI